VCIGIVGKYLCVLGTGIVVLCVLNGNKYLCVLETRISIFAYWERE
jgi:hypothetical protein